MVKVKLKRIGVLKFSLFAAIYSALAGLVLGIIIAIVSMMFPLGDTFSGASIFLGIGAIISFPITSAIGGFIMTLILTLLMNLALKIIKGVDINLEELG